LAGTCTDIGFGIATRSASALRIQRFGHQGDDFEQLFNSRRSAVLRTSAVREKVAPRFGLQKGAQL
jgi:hypothetical protein